MSDERYSRQSFLGEDSQSAIEKCKVGIVGLGGGGSHIIQQLSHLGFKDYEIYDPDRAELSNLNRTVGATLQDARDGTPKVEIAKRVILGLQPDARIGVHQLRWQDDPEPLMNRHLVFGCLDGLDERRQLESATRRYLIPLIDIGLGVALSSDEPPYMAGQIILSMPGGPCMACLGFLNDRGLAAEAQKYGDAGPRPQVIWSNGLLASTAIGIAVELLTGWTRRERPPVYLDYRANESSLAVHAREIYAPKEPCSHFPAEDVGPVRLRSL